MRQESEYKPINLKRTLSEMKWWAKERDRRYREQKKLAKFFFGPLVKKLGLDSSR